MSNPNTLSPEVMRSMAMALLGGGLGYAFNPLKSKFLSASLGSLAGYAADRAWASYEQEKPPKDTSPDTAAGTSEGGTPQTTGSRMENQGGPEKPSAFPGASLLANSLWFKSVVPKAVIPGAGAAAAAGGAGTWLPPALLATQAEQAVEGALDPDRTMRDLYGTRNPLEFWRWGSARNIGAALRMAGQALNQLRESRRTDRETLQRAVQRAARQGNLGPDLSIYR